MDDQIHVMLARWGNFSLITGTAAATLTGLQFIVQTLLLICVGIHNAWDTVTYLTLNALRADASQRVPVPSHRGAPPKRKRNRR